MDVVVLDGVVEQVISLAHVELDVLDVLVRLAVDVLEMEDPLLEVGGPVHVALADVRLDMFQDGLDRLVLHLLR